MNKKKLKEQQLSMMNKQINKLITQVANLESVRFNMQFKASMVEGNQKVNEYNKVMDADTIENLMHELQENEDMMI